MNPYKVVTHVPPFLHGSLKQRLWPEFQEQKLSVSLVSWTSWPSSAPS